LDGVRVQSNSDPKREGNVLVAHSYGTVLSIKLLAHLHSRDEQNNASEHEKEEEEGEEEEEENSESMAGPAYFKKVVLVGAAGDRPPGTAHPIWYVTAIMAVIAYGASHTQDCPNRYLPAFVLEWIRPVMGKGFVDKAWHPSTDRCAIHE
jgi:hypothetical protein